MSSRLCAVCNSVFTGARVMHQDQAHHQSELGVRRAADQGCYICSIILRSDEWKTVDRSAPFKSVWHLSEVDRLPSDWLKLTIDMIGDGVGEDEDEVSLASDEAEIEQRKRDDYLAQASEDESVDPKLPIWGFLLYAAADEQQAIMADWTLPTECDNSSFFDIAQRWLSTCVSSHSSSTPSKPDFRPTRLLEIVSEEIVRVIVPHEQPTHGPYVTLSHCWGQALHLKLLRSNLAQLRREIKLKELPTSYQEAIRVCRQLGLHYIWIDSLCILQDSMEDWQREASTMGDVYGQSIMTIAAAAAAESSASCFTSRDVSLIQPLAVQAEWDDRGSTKFHLFDGDIYENEVRHSPLARRAWVVQELWMSSRTLYLTSSQLWWECREFGACEAFPGGIPSAYFVNGGKPAADYSKAAVVHDTWTGMISTYTGCSLTVLSDRMVACSGIAQSFQKLLPSDTYLAGLWRSQLPQALYWESSSERAGRRPPCYRAPSWSWASIERAVDQFASATEFADTDSVKVCCGLRDIATYPAGHDDKGSLTGGFIKIKGHLTEVCSRGGTRDRRITVQQADGSWDYIEGSDEGCRRSARRQSWTSFAWDECTPSGDPMISYLENFPQQTPWGTSMSSATRTAVYTEIRHWAGTTWTFPIVEYSQDAKRFCGGIVLCQMPGWPDEVFQRVGSFHAAGDITIDELKRRSTEKVFTVL